MFEDYVSCLRFARVILELKQLQGVDGWCFVEVGVFQMGPLEADC